MSVHVHVVLLQKFAYSNSYNLFLVGSIVGGIIGFILLILTSVTLLAVYWMKRKTLCMLTLFVLLLPNLQVYTLD